MNSGYPPSPPAIVLDDTRIVCVGFKTKTRLNGGTGGGDFDVV